MNPSVLVCWLSVNHYAAPIIAALSSTTPSSPCTFGHLHLCWRDAADGQREKQALETTLGQLRELGDDCPQIIMEPWRTSSSPTEHGAIRLFAEATLKRIRKQHPDALIRINLSPGTPAMHAVWLALCSTGLIEGPLELVQTNDAKAVAAGAAAVQAIEFELDTWLQRYRGSRPGNTGSDDTGHNLDPSRVKSPAMREALSKLEMWAPLRIPVLLVGERGTGKTTLANLLRSNSPFQKKGQKTWPSVVCGQFRVNPQLARSELFGHAKGAFTGATQDRVGLLEQADGDSLFLDEIADIDRDTQRLLMAALEGRGFQRIGEPKMRYSTFRLICATNRPVRQLQNELLDPDFFDRIGIFVLTVPALRDCVEDIPQAWEKVLASALRVSGTDVPGWQRFTDHEHLLLQLKHHPLPGNFRDLQRVAYHLLAALMAGRSEAEILREALSALPAEDTAPAALPCVAELIQQLPIDDIRSKIGDYEKAWFSAALTRSDGNKAEAARLLGIPRKTFEHRLKGDRKDSAD